MILLVLQVLHPQVSFVSFLRFFFAATQPSFLSETRKLAQNQRTALLNKAVLVGIGVVYGALLLFSVFLYFYIPDKSLFTMIFDHDE